MYPSAAPEPGELVGLSPKDLLKLYVHHMPRRKAELFRWLLRRSRITFRNWRLLPNLLI